MPEVRAGLRTTAPELGPSPTGGPPPLAMTANRTSEVHRGLRRRCLCHWVDSPDAARERAILALRAAGLPERLSADVVRFVRRVRGGDCFKLRGVAETMDWAQALAARGAKELEPGPVD